MCLLLALELPPLGLPKERIFIELTTSDRKLKRPDKARTKGLTRKYTASQNISPKSTALASQSLKSIGCHGGTLSGNLTAEDQPVDLGEMFWLAVK